VSPFDTTANAPFALNVVLNNKRRQIVNVGYGVSQVLPIIIEILRTHGGQWFAIQQPEIHLHPRAQASLGDLTFEAAVRDNKKFIIETHSDFIINRFRQRMQAEPDANINAQVVFFERNAQGNKAHVIGLEGDGKYSPQQPPGFKSFFLEEELKNLRV
jgi:predicted ATPase